MNLFDPNIREYNYYEYDSFTKGVLLDNTLNVLAYKREKEVLNTKQSIIKNKEEVFLKILNVYPRHGRAHEVFDSKNKLLAKTKKVQSWLKTKIILNDRSNNLLLSARGNYQGRDFVITDKDKKIIAEIKRFEGMKQLQNTFHNKEKFLDERFRTGNVMRMKVLDLEFNRFFLLSFFIIIFFDEVTQKNREDSYKYPSEYRI